ncbi:hypothetical protein FQN57_004911 [Myotisia sp. PD_48]|nr:hypothetical protein FQN57_004911 [Myotisia sp. PD_48]
MAIRLVVRKRGTVQIFRDLLILSRFHKYNPWLATFSGVWSALLAGILKTRSSPAAISTTFVFRQALMVFLAAYAFCGAGMVWNDWIDCDIDANVARTKNRPLAAGRLTSIEALVWMFVQLIISWYLLHVMLGGSNVWITLIPVTISSFLYPFAKLPIARKLYIFPQYILGFSLAYPAVAGWMAIYGKEQTFLETAGHCLPLCTFVFCWTLYLNTAYSYQDIEDDSKMNLNSAYFLAGNHIHIFLTTLALLVLVTIPFVLHTFGSSWLWTSWMGIWTVSYAYQLLNFDAKKPAGGGSIHKSNFALGMWTTIICAIELLLKSNS